MHLASVFGVSEDFSHGAPVFCYVPSAWAERRRTVVWVADEESVSAVQGLIAPRDRVVVELCHVAPQDGVGFHEAGGQPRFSSVRKGDRVSGMVVGLLRRLMR